MNCTEGKLEWFGGNEDALNMWRTATGRKVPDNDDPKYIKSIKNSLWKNFIFTTAIGEDT